MRIRNRPSVAGWVWLALILGLPFGAWGTGHAQDKPLTENRKVNTRPFLRMTEAVVCDSIAGYENYKPLPGAALTKDEKLLVYYRPLNFRTSLVNGSYTAHLTQDVKIRRRGSKKVIWEKPKMVDYTTPKSDLPPSLIYMRNTIALKDLPPGEYDLVIVLHDEFNESRTATQSVKFRVVPADDARKKGGESPPEKEGKNLPEKEGKSPPEKEDPSP